jgi:hypothetical protein
MLDDGVTFNGKRYRSLTEVARETPEVGGQNRASSGSGRIEWRIIMQQLKPSLRRCTIYTRKSSEQGSAHGDPLDSNCFTRRPPPVG